jgi:hypothetical protein
VLQYSHVQPAAMSLSAMVSQYFTMSNLASPVQTGHDHHRDSPPYRKGWQCFEAPVCSRRGRRECERRPWSREEASATAIALIGYGIGACHQNVMLDPSEDDLLVLNDCVVRDNWGRALTDLYVCDIDTRFTALCRKYARTAGALVRALTRPKQRSSYNF